MGVAGGEALPRAAARPFQGEVLLWGAQSLSPPWPTGAPRAQCAQLLPGPHSVRGPSPSSPPPSPPRLASPQRPRPFNWPLPDPNCPRGQGQAWAPPTVSGVQTPPTAGSRGGGGPCNLPPSPGPAPGLRPLPYGYPASGGG